MRACTHGMPSPASCIECMEDGPVMPPSAQPQVEVEAVLVARFDGHCSRCNLPIHIDQYIVRLSDDRYVHAGCAPR